jgi:hypothetical protein
MKPAKACPHCEGSVGLPHRSEVDCFRFVDHEIKGAVAYLRSLTRRKSRLLRLRARSRQQIVAARRARGRKQVG